MKRSPRGGVFFVLLSVAALVACGGEYPNEPQATVEADPVDSGLEFPLALDQGNRWQVDVHTRASAARLTALVRDSGQIDSVENARELGAGLDAELSTLIQGCTMTGPAHDQLHVFLMELFPRVGRLKEEADPAQLEVVRGEISSLFDAYDKHFE